MFTSIKKSIVLISLGVINLLHAILHTIQFIQSMLLVNAATFGSQHLHTHDETFIDSILHNPYFAIVWGLIGLLTLWIGIKDFIHHRNCKH